MLFHVVPAVRRALWWLADPAHAIWVAGFVKCPARGAVSRRVSFTLVYAEMADGGLQSSPAAFSDQAAACGRGHLP